MVIRVSHSIMNVQYSVRRNKTWTIPVKGGSLWSVFRGIRDLLSTIGRKLYTKLK